MQTHYLILRTQFLSSFDYQQKYKIAVVNIAIRNRLNMFDDLDNNDNNIFVHRDKFFI